MTLPLPDIHVEGFDGARRNFEAIAQALVDTGGRQLRMRVGTSAITWPGGSGNSNITTTSHGLGTTPVVVLATLTASSVANFPNVATFTYTSTTFKVQLQTTDGSTPANTATGSVVWVAIG